MLVVETSKRVRICHNCRSDIKPGTAHVRAKTGWPHNEHDRSHPRPGFYFNYCRQCIDHTHKELEHQSEA